MRISLLALGFGLAGCALEVGREPLREELGALEPDSTAVCWQDVRQSISGFGASSAWTAPDVPDELADELFSVDRIGLSLLRLRIAPTGTTSEVGTAEKAQARGAAVWAAPWSPPGAWKTSGTDIYGGELLVEHYQAWAERLALFVREREDQGIHISALSAQNEPDYVAEWETCEWEPSALATFVGEHLVPALEAQGVSPTLLAPESSGWDDVARYGEALLEHAGAGPAIGIVATHHYGRAAPYAYRSPAEQGKELWMTEWSDSTGDGPDHGMTSGLVVARAIHENLTVGEVNAWHYWWLIERSDTPPGKGGLLSEDVITRRAYVTGQYSRFVRPGSRRIHLSRESLQSGVYASAFLRESGSDFVLVVVNENDAPVVQSFDFEGAEVSDLVPYVTNDSVALEEQSPVSAGTAIRYEFSPRSVTTFQGPVTVFDGALPSRPCSSLLSEEESTSTGCSCRVAGGTRAPGAPLALFALAGAAFVRRARSRALS
jgi:glucuronoarabinoxylan endo-1,4-beta-xylanase